MTGLTDEQLVKACLEGKEEAWSELIDKYKNLIFSIPIRHGMSREDAGEIFQQVCVKLLSELPDIRDPKCLGAWLIRVTSHSCFHWGRRERRSEQMASEVDEISTAPAAELADESLFQAEREQILREALLEISPRCRQLIHMLFYEDPALPYEDVARKLGLARGSIGFIRMRCLRQLRLRLHERHFL
jgi:RNA polymerase sigma factor (sigma-70 family)